MPPADVGFPGRSLGALLDHRTRIFGVCWFVMVVFNKARCNVVGLHGCEGRLNSYKSH